ncbi:hypothetical protein N658DRAFT_173753 [Parathielavia hyrcaniae]|uniref:Uncharacterized protein n=1 Tax=Parathielavia hyrcaniae TaxID=113614 RepID=A0AAN6SZE9_9PEZI|nr:hypothetical protein N658DRAFT_173753 [Parathielavia hyrcaniae]
MRHDFLYSARTHSTLVSPTRHFRTPDPRDNPRPCCHSHHATGVRATGSRSPDRDPIASPRAGPVCLPWPPHQKQDCIRYNKQLALRLEGLLYSMKLRFNMRGEAAENYPLDLPRPRYKYMRSTGGRPKHGWSRWKRPFHGLLRRVGNRPRRIWVKDGLDSANPSASLDKRGQGNGPQLPARLHRRSRAQGSAEREPLAGNSNPGEEVAEGR